MENNEDKRQYTVISEAISLIEDYTGVYVTDEGCSFQYMTPEGVKYMLESLLLKEREIIEAAYNKGHEHTYSFDHDAGYGRVEISISSETYFKETFKQIENGK